MGAQKIDNSRLNTYGREIALFQIDDKEKKSRFFKKTFSSADMNMNIVFGMFFSP